jgi:hypothetical protein
MRKADHLHSWVPPLQKSYHGTCSNFLYKLIITSHNPGFSSSNLVCFHTLTILDNNPWLFVSVMSEWTWCLYWFINCKICEPSLQTPCIGKNENGKRFSWCLQLYHGSCALKSCLHIIWYLSCGAKMLVSQISSDAVEDSLLSAEQFACFLLLPLIYLMWMRQCYFLEGGWMNTTGKVRSTNHRQNVECSSLM